MISGGTKKSKEEQIYKCLLQFPSRNLSLGVSITAVVTSKFLSAKFKGISKCPWRTN
jgi:hypothetical protein